MPLNNISTLQRTPASAGCALEQFAHANRLQIDFLRQLGLADVSYMQVPAVRIPYLDVDDVEAVVRVRTGQAGVNRFR
jgi:hypothetical protein